VRVDTAHLLGGDGLGRPADPLVQKAQRADGVFCRSGLAFREIAARLSAAGLVRVLGGISLQPLLSKEELQPEKSEAGGLVIVGSHVKKATDVVQF